MLITNLLCLLIGGTLTVVVQQAIRRRRPGPRAAALSAPAPGSRWRRHDRSVTLQGCSTGSTMRPRRVVDLAPDEALALGHAAVGPEHLLLALTLVGGPVSELLTVQGVTHAATDGAVVEVAGTRARRRDRHPPFDDAATAVLHAGDQLASDRGDDHVTPAHLLLALLDTDDGVADEVLAGSGRRPRGAAAGRARDPRRAARGALRVQRERPESMLRVAVPHGWVRGCPMGPPGGNRAPLRPVRSRRGDPTSGAWSRAGRSCAASASVRRMPRSIAAARKPAIAPTRAAVQARGIAAGGRRRGPRRGIERCFRRGVPGPARRRPRRSHLGGRTRRRRRRRPRRDGGEFRIRPGRSGRRHRRTGQLPRPRARRGEHRDLDGGQPVADDAPRSRGGRRRHVAGQSRHAGVVREPGAPVPRPPGQPWG